MCDLISDCQNVLLPELFVPDITTKLLPQTHFPFDCYTYKNVLCCFLDGNNEIDTYFTYKNVLCCFLDGNNEIILLV